MGEEQGAGGKITDLQNLSKKQLLGPKYRRVDDIKITLKELDTCYTFLAQDGLHWSASI